MTASQSMLTSILSRVEHQNMLLTGEKVTKNHTILFYFELRVEQIDPFGTVSVPKKTSFFVNRFSQKADLRLILAELNFGT